MPAAPLLAGWETILVVEDDDMLRNMAREMLEEAGYRIITARDGRDALKIMHDFDAPVHLVLTDVVMPGMSGRDLEGRLQLKFPDIKVIYMSGYTADIMAHHGILDRGVEFIRKPFAMEGLAAKVRGVLDKD